MTSLRSPYSLYPFDIFLKPKYDFGGWLSLYKRANQNFYIRKVSGTIPANLGCIVEQTVKYKRNKRT
jgi:hypothetical protein